MMHAVAHVKSGAVAGLEARVALQKGREEAQRLLKLASGALQHQQLPRSASFPPKGRPTPIGPTSSYPQVILAPATNDQHAIKQDGDCLAAALLLPNPAVWC